MADSEASPAGDSADAEDLERSGEFLARNFSKDVQRDRISDLIALIKESADKLARIRPVAAT